MAGDQAVRHMPARLTGGCQPIAGHVPDPELMTERIAKLFPLALM
jgi:hypothetical protein